MKDGFLKIACATPDVRVGDCDYNTDRILELISQAHTQGVKIICFPELSITGYTAGIYSCRKHFCNLRRKT